MVEADARRRILFKMHRESQIIAGIDVGTTKVVCIIGEATGTDIEIIGVGSHPCRGIQKGIVIDIDNTAEAIKHAVGQASQQAGCHISCVFVSVNGQTGSRSSPGMVTIRGKEVEKEDVDRVLDAASSIVLPQNQRLIHILPQEFIVNGQDGIKNPIGMCGVRLETKVHLVTAAEPNLQNLTKCIKRNNLEIESFVLDHLAGSLAVLQDDEKELGVAYVDIGGSVINIIIYIDESVMHTATLPLGSGHITKDIAVGLNTPLSSAESIKQKYGHAIVEQVDDEPIDVPMVGGRPEQTISRKQLCQFIQPRVEQIFDYIHRAIQQSTLLSALASGVVLGGGGSILPGTAVLAQEIIGVPVRLAKPYGVGGMSNVLDSPQYATSVGLIRFAVECDGMVNALPDSYLNRASRGTRKGFLKAVGEWFKEVIG